MAASSYAATIHHRSNSRWRTVERSGATRSRASSIASRALSPHLFAHLTDPDRSYALQEWTALHISWLSALKVPVLNRPVMQGLCGAWRHESEWKWLATRAGLQTSPFTQQGTLDGSALQQPTPVHGAVTTRTVFVVDGRVVADGLSTESTAACAALARLSDTRMLGNRSR